MTRTIAHVVNRLIIDTGQTFDDVRQRYESLVPTIDFAELVAVIQTGDLARLQAYTAEHTPHSFAIDATLDPMPVMALSGHQRRGLRQVMSGASRGEVGVDGGDHH